MTSLALLTLLRVCAGEAGIDAGPDCPAIHAVLVDRGERMGMHWTQAARLYSPGHMGLRDRPHARPWVPHLRPDCQRPRHWPTKLSWARHRPGCERLVMQVRAVLRGDEVAPCAGRVHHWGDRHGDRVRATRAGWLPVDCGVGARNLYWSVPALLRRDA